MCPNILRTVLVVLIVDVCNKVTVVLNAETIHEHAEDSSRPANAAHCAGLVGAARANRAGSVYSKNVKVSVELETALNFPLVWKNSFWPTMPTYVASAWVETVTVTICGTVFGEVTVESKVLWKSQRGSCLIHCWATT